jgi:hypothetical protein
MKLFVLILVIGTLTQLSLGLRVPMQKKVASFSSFDNAELRGASLALQHVALQSGAPTVPLYNDLDSAWIGPASIGTPPQGPYRLIYDTGSADVCFNVSGQEREKKEREKLTFSAAT